MRAAMVLKKINARGVQVGVMAVGTRNQIIFSFFAASRLLPCWIGAHIRKILSDPELRTFLQLDRPQPPSARLLRCNRNCLVDRCLF